MLLKMKKDLTEINGEVLNKVIHVVNNKVVDRKGLLKTGNNAAKGFAVKRDLWNNLWSIKL